MIERGPVLRVCCNAVPIAAAAMLVVGLGTKIRRLLAALDGDVQRAYDESGAEFRPRFYPVVQRLLETGSAGVVELARESGVSQPAMTQTLQQMSSAGLIRMTPGADGRSREVTLSAQGRGLAEALRPLWAAVQRAAVELERTLPQGLERPIDQALEELERVSFGDRIRTELAKDKQA